MGSARSRVRSYKLFRFLVTPFSFAYLDLATEPAVKHLLPKGSVGVSWLLHVSFAFWVCYFLFLSLNAFLRALPLSSVGS